MESIPSLPMGLWRFADPELPDQWWTHACSDPQCIPCDSVPSSSGACDLYTCVFICTYHVNMMYIFIYIWCTCDVHMMYIYVRYFEACWRFFISHLVRDHSANFLMLILHLDCHRVIESWLAHKASTFLEVKNLEPTAKLPVCYPYQK